jgi:hypothetical protein
MWKEVVVSLFGQHPNLSVDGLRKTATKKKKTCQDSLPPGQQPNTGTRKYNSTAKFCGVAWTWKINAYIILVTRPRKRWNNNIKMDLRLCRWELLNGEFCYQKVTFSQGIPHEVGHAFPVNASSIESL